MEPKNRGGRPPRPGGARTQWKKARVDGAEAKQVDALLKRNGYPATETGLRDFLLHLAAAPPGEVAA
jgi:hypothetical protein